MHISEGVLNAKILLTGGAVAIGALTYSLSKMENRRIPKVAVMSAAFFVASLVHVPVGPANFHLVLIGIVGILLGWSSFPAITIALFLQAVLFGFGGLTTLGVNICIMGIPAVITYAVFYKFNWKNHVTSSILGFGCGALAVFIAATLLMFVLTTTGESFVMIAKVVFWAHLPLAVIEGIITMFVVGFLRKVRPEIFYQPGAAA